MEKKSEIRTRSKV